MADCPTCACPSSAQRPSARGALSCTRACSAVSLTLPLARAADLETIGKTPMVRLSNLLTEEMKAAGTLVLGKMEMQNPGGSVKDRIALNMIEDAESSGKLKPGMTVIEYTSGNTGIGLAMVCAAKGYKCIIVMPQIPSFMERYIICRQFGAEVRLTAPAKGMPGMKAYVEELLAADENLFCTSQFDNPANPATHTATTGPEILEQCGGKVDYFVGGVGTGGTIAGLAGFLKEKAGTHTIAVEPTESRVNIGESHAAHSIMGIGAGVVPPFIEAQAPGEPMSDAARGNIAEFQSSTSEEAVAMAIKLAQTEGMMVGPSAGAAMKVALEVAARPEAAGKTIVVLLASHGIRYTQHPLWAAAKKEAAVALPGPPNMDKDAPIELFNSATYTPPAD
jgi:cysteine synthase A